MTATGGLALIGAVWLATSLAGAFWLASQDHVEVVATMLALAIPYGAAAWWVVRNEARLAGRRPLVLVLGLALVARVALLPSPTVSTDIFRYVWDGRVQAEGINPYRYLPADPVLERLRDPDIFPNINRAETAVTIYPPAAELVFWIATRIRESVTGVKVAVVLIELAGMAALVGFLRARGIADARVLLYVWHPVPLFEFAGSGHVDAVAIAFMLIALWAAERRSPTLAGIALAVGAGAKYFPAFVAPALYGRWDWRMPAAFCATLLLLYVPYLGVGRGVLGFFPGYVDEEGISGANGIAWLSLIGQAWPLPGWVPATYLAVAGACLLALGFAIAFRSRPDRVSPGGAMLLLSAFTVVVTPHYTWYYAWIVPFLCVRASPALIWLTAASPLLYGILWPYVRVGTEALVFLPFLLILIGERLVRRLPSALPEYRDDSRVGHQPAA